MDLKAAETINKERGDDGYMEFPQTSLELQN